MSDQDVFESNPASSDQNTGNPAQQSASELPSEVMELVGEGKKYATVNDALIGLANAQAHISKIEQENKEMRDDISQRTSAEEILKRIEASRSSGETHQPELDKEAVAQLVKETVDSVDKEKAKAANRTAVNDKLKALYNDKASEFLNGKAQELGVDVSYLKDIAEKSPSAFYKMVDIDGSKKTGSDSFNTKSSVNTENSKQNFSGSEEFGTYQYYQKLRKENPSHYYSLEVQRQMHKHAKELGDKFFG